MKALPIPGDLAQRELEKTNHDHPFITLLYPSLPYPAGLSVGLTREKAKGLGMGSLRFFSSGPRPGAKRQSMEVWRVNRRSKQKVSRMPGNSQGFQCM